MEGEATSNGGAGPMLVLKAGELIEQGVHEAAVNAGLSILR